MRDELLRTRRRCAELSEGEARKRGLEFRCLGLERVVEELMVAVELLRTERAGDMQEGMTTLSHLSGRGVDESKDRSRQRRHIEMINGLEIEMDKKSFVKHSPPTSQHIFIERTSSNIEDLSFRDVCISLIITSRRRFIPYQLRAIICFLIRQFRHNEFIDRILGLGIIIVGAVLWTSFLILEKVKSSCKTRRFEEQPTKKKRKTMKQVTESN
jgi:hypothetical protein